MTTSASSRPRHQGCCSITVKERTGLAAIGSCNDDTSAKYAHFVCAINSQKLHELLEKAWTFSVALDLSTHMEKSYHLILRTPSKVVGKDCCNFQLLWASNNDV